jgi:hypothetical protein
MAQAMAANNEAMLVLAEFGMVKIPFKSGPGLGEIRCDGSHSGGNAEADGYKSANDGGEDGSELVADRDGHDNFLSVNLGSGCFRDIHL